MAHLVYGKQRFIMCLQQYQKNKVWGCLRSPRNHCCRAEVPYGTLGLTRSLIGFLASWCQLCSSEISPKKVAKCSSEFNFEAQQAWLTYQRNLDIAKFIKPWLQSSLNTTQPSAIIFTTMPSTEGIQSLISEIRTLCTELPTTIAISSNRCHITQVMTGPKYESSWMTCHEFQISNYSHGFRRVLWNGIEALGGH